VRIVMYRIKRYYDAVADCELSYSRAFDPPFLLAGLSDVKDRLRFDTH
jgi:hypothetical protein